MDYNISVDNFDDIVGVSSVWFIFRIADRIQS